MSDHSRKKQEAVIEGLARKWLGNELGQVIVGKNHVYVYLVARASPVMHLEHEQHAFEGARAALRWLIRCKARALSDSELEAMKKAAETAAPPPAAKAPTP